MPPPATRPRAAFLFPVLSVLSVTHGLTVLPVLYMYPVLHVWVVEPVETGAHGIATVVVMTSSDEGRTMTSTAQASEKTLVRPGETVAVCNQKGGQGKTTTAVSLAAELAGRGARVRLIDADAQDGSATMWLPPQWDDVAREEQYDLVHALTGEVDLDAATWPTTVSGLDIVPSYTSLKRFEREQTPGRDIALQAAIAEAADYDVTLIDCPPNLDQITVTALVAASAVVIPVKAGGLDLEGIRELNKTLGLVRSRLRADQRTAAVVVTQKLNSALTEQVIELLATDYPDAVHAVIRHTVRVAEAPLAHQPLTVYAPEATATADYAAMAATVFAPVLDTLVEGAR